MSHLRTNPGVYQAYGYIDLAYNQSIWYVGLAIAEPEPNPNRFWFFAAREIQITHLWPFGSMEE
jgi:hypothetical protein